MIIRLLLPISLLYSIGSQSIDPKPHECKAETATTLCKTITENKTEQDGELSDNSYGFKLYKEIKKIETPRLVIELPKITDEECELIKTLNNEAESKALNKNTIKWSLIDLPKEIEHDNEAIKSVIKLNHIAGDFFNGLWFLKEKGTSQPIGLFHTSSLSEEDNRSEISIHIRKSCFGKKYGLEALQGLDEIFGQYKNKKVKLPLKEKYKESIIPLLATIAQSCFFNKENVGKLLDDIQHADENTEIFGSQYINDFGGLASLIRTCTLSLGNFYRTPKQYSGLKACNLTGAFRNSLMQAGFKKGSPEDWWYR